VSLSELANLSEAEIDERVFRLYHLNSAERALVSNFANVTLPDFKNLRSSKARQPITTWPNALEKYCHWFLRVLKSGFGEDKPICATIFTTDSDTDLPYCIIALHLDWPSRDLISYESLRKEKLLLKLAELDLASQRQKNGAIYYRRVCKVYWDTEITNHGVKRNIPTVFLIKPNQVRYWTRSMAMRDADEVAGDIMLWREESGSKRKH
jgi:hypothetical protein